VPLLFAGGCSLLAPVEPEVPDAGLPADVDAGTIVDAGRDGGLWIRDGGPREDAGDHDYIRDGGDDAGDAGREDGGSGDGGPPDGGLGDGGGSGSDAGSGDGGGDGGPPDGGLGDGGGGGDAGYDAGDFDGGYDAGDFDAGYDAGYDAGDFDGGYDAGFDGGYDAGFDGGYDAGFDGGYDAGFDGGYDAGFDGGYDAGPMPFGYSPVNLDPSLYTPTKGFDVASACTEYVINGPIVVDTDAITLELTSCGGGFEGAVKESVDGGPARWVVPVSYLHVQSGFEVELRGATPVLFAVYGPVTIESGAELRSISTPTDESKTRCGAGAGNAPSHFYAGAGGGGFGGVGGNGGSNGAASSVGGLGGSAILGVDFEPLRAGCPGSGVIDGTNGGAAGGGLQISSSSTLSIDGAVRVPGQAPELGPAGGQPGGAGGGSGGLLILTGEELVISATTELDARGGGGAAGHEWMGPGRADPGQSADKTAFADRPPGGVGQAGGSGGAGSGRSGALPGEFGLAGDEVNDGSFHGGGGGGGGAGGIAFQLSKGFDNIDSTIFPAPRTVP
jgi:hypothetical protein